MRGGVKKSKIALVAGVMLSAGLALTGCGVNNDSQGEKQEDYSIAYDLNGGTGIENTNYVLENDSVTLPTNVTRAGYVFDGWYLDGSEVTSISKDTFKNSDKNSLTIKAKWKDVFTYEDSSKTVITGLTPYARNEMEIVIPKTVTKIGASAFRENLNLTTVTFEEGSQLVSIGEDAFDGCIFLRSITIPAGVNEIGEDAFLYCAHLIEVRNLSSLNITVDSNENGLVAYYATYVYGPTDDYDASFVENDGIVYYVKGNQKIAVGPATDMDRFVTKVTLDSDCTSINQNAFYGCFYLKSIVIPANVTSIGDYAFYSCCCLVEVYNLSNLTITTTTTVDPEENREDGYIGVYARVIHKSLDEKSNLVKSHGVVYYVNGDEKIAVGLVDINATTLTLVGDCTGINSGAFRGCEKIENVTIPRFVTFVGSCAFYGCSNLESVTFEDTNGWSWVGSSAGTADLSSGSTNASNLKEGQKSEDGLKKSTT